MQVRPGRCHLQRGDMQSGPIAGKELLVPPASLRPFVSHRDKGVTHTLTCSQMWHRQNSGDIVKVASGLI